MLNAECGMLNAECRMLNAEFRMLNSRPTNFKAQCTTGNAPVGANSTLIAYLTGTGARDGASVGVFRLPFLPSSVTGQRSRLSGMV